MDKPISDLDYVSFYAKKLREDSKFFKDYVKFINSQFRGSRELFNKRFGRGSEFKKRARRYLGV